MTAKDPKVMGETLQILPNAFVDNKNPDVILLGQKILVYVGTANS
jgi:hypothetical protein